MFRVYRKCFLKTLPQRITFMQGTMKSGEGQGMYVIVSQAVVRGSPEAHKL
jgi:hypothetical protein